MPMARTRRGRLRQVERWLNNHFPTPRPTIVRVRDFRKARSSSYGFVWGETSRVGCKIHIMLHSNLPAYLAIETLLHEWAHAVAWPLASMEHKVRHDMAWQVAYGQIYEAYYDKDGWLESRAYSPD